MEQNENFAFNMKEIADNANVKFANELAEAIMQEIKKGCYRVAESGQYEFPLLDKPPFGFLYNPSTEKKFLISVITERAKQLGLEFGERRQESFSLPEYYVSFANAKKVETEETKD